MRKYFIYSNDIKDGPFELEKLKEQSITRDTLVWYEGLGSWTTAGKIPEISALLNSIPPPLPTDFHSNNIVKDDVINSFTYAEEMNEDDDRKSLLLPVLITLIIIAGLLITLFYYHK